MFWIVVLAALANAETGLGNTECMFSGGRLKIVDGAVTLNGQKFPMGIETVTEAGDVSYSAFMNGASSECQIKTHMASVAANGDVVLLVMHRSKASRSKGVLCRFARDINGFSDPFRFEQIVLSKDPAGAMIVRKLSVTDESDRPSLRAADLKNPNVSEENQALRAYVAKYASLRGRGALLTREKCASPDSNSDKARPEAAQ